MNIIKSAILSVLMAGVGVLLIGSAISLAASPLQDSKPVIAAATVTPGQNGQVEVSIQYADAEGQAFRGLEVSFFLEADFLGQTRVFLGRTVTDATGTARTSYAPTWEGTQRVAARLTGGEAFQGTEATILFDVTGISNIYTPVPSVLDGLREWTPIGVGSVVLLVWAILAVVLVRTTYGIMEAGRRKDISTLGYTVHAAVTASQPRRQQHGARRE